jgi:nicotinamide-nucleotide amidase
VGGPGATPRAEILAVGDELTAGDRPNTNSTWIARELLALGIEARFHTIVGDDPDDLGTAFRAAAQRARFLVVTGGIGPTEDDRTRQVAAEVAGVPLVEDPASWKHIVARFRSRGLRPSPSNRLQAMTPAGGRVLPNRAGTAPGFEVAVGGATLFAVPGVPSEMEIMVREQVLPRIRELAGVARCLVQKTLHLTGATESEVGERIADLMPADRDPRVGITVSGGIITVRILASGDDPGDAAARAEATAALVRPRVATLLFAEDGRSLAQATGELLIERGVTFALAESCTGGLLASLLCDVPGISAVFREGFVTYANESKTARLGVPESVLREHGAVSAATALAMASGVRAAAGVRLGAAITGIAGPGGGTPDKPVGLVFLAVDLDGAATAERRFYPGSSRREVRERAARDCLHWIRRRLLAEGAGGAGPGPVAR